LAFTIDYMFAPYCARHRSRVLLGYESVINIENGPLGPTILLRCHCGDLLTHDAAPTAQRRAAPTAQRRAAPTAQRRATPTAQPETGPAVPAPC
jgi:hypothetical protein